ncbi:MAG: carboxy terminal-processing peptidase [Verrucomicrobiota bacterium]|nr:carboxy terminal-processing peptidase [Verrucomicrobiota bacterium]
MTKAFPRLHLKRLAPLALAALLPWSGASAAGTRTNAPATLAPGPNDGRIAFWTARLLEEYHYSQHPLDAAMSKKFYDGYLDELDPQHVDFLQSDLATSAHYRTNLDKLTITDSGSADLAPAYDIFRRFLERVHQRVAYVDKLLQHDRFDFNTDERIQLDRHDAAWPKDLDEARQLWRRRLRWEFLQEKLNLDDSPTNARPAVLRLTKAEEDQIRARLQHRYDRSLRLFTEMDGSDVLQIYLEALAHAYDPHSDYFNLEHAQDFSIGMSLSLFGIGAELRSDDGYCTILSLVPGGPAAKSKQIKVNDRILAVAQSNQPPVDVVDMELSKIVQMIRGPKGTVVRLTIAPADGPGARHVVTLVRDEIKLEDQEAKADLIEVPDGHGGANRLGVLEVPAFYATINYTDTGQQLPPKSLSADVTRLIQKLKREHVQGIIIDLRNNGGGSLDEAVKFVGLFIKDGPVVLVRKPNGRVLEDDDTDPSVLYGGPLVVLVNRASASASEIAAGALQDYGRAVVVGDTSTFGKGTVQDINPLRPFIWPATETATNDPGVVKITIRKFYRVSGASTQLKGVTPDIVLPDVLSYATDLGESALPNALPWDTIPSASYDKLNLVGPYLADLRRRSETRVATNRDFVHIRRDIAEFKKMQAEKTVSLNEREELNEREQADARKKAWDAELARRKAPDEKTFEITVENAGKPGLPPPLAETNALAGVLATNIAATAATILTNAPPEIDPMLDETEHILEDYIALMGTNRAMIAIH